MIAAHGRRMFRAFGDAFYTSYLPLDIFPCQAMGAEIKLALFYFLYRELQSPIFWWRRISLSWKASFGDKRATSLSSIQPILIVTLPGLSLSETSRWKPAPVLLFPSNLHLTLSRIIRPKGTATRGLSATIAEAAARCQPVFMSRAPRVFSSKKIIWPSWPIKLMLGPYLSIKNLPFIVFLRSSFWKAQCEFQHKLKSALRFPKSKKM